jgi:hypothetical protein
MVDDLDFDQDGSFPWENIHATIGMIRGQISILPAGMI